MNERMEKLQQFLKAQPNDSFLQHALALEHVKLGNDAEAQRYFLNILEHDPSYVGSYYHLGRTYERSGDHQAAIQVYEKGLKAARAANDMHAASELQMAIDELSDD